MAKNIFGQRVPSQPRAVNRKMFKDPLTDEDPKKRQTETLVSALRTRKPKKPSFMGV